MPPAYSQMNLGTAPGIFLYIHQLAPLGFRKLGTLTPALHPHAGALHCSCSYLMHYLQWQPLLFGKRNGERWSANFEGDIFF